jgi:hypothetical protein
VGSTTAYDNGGLSIVVVDTVTIEVRTSLRLADREAWFYVVFAACLVAAIAALSFKHGWGIASWVMVPAAVVPFAGAVWRFRRNRRQPAARVDRERWTVQGGPLVGLTELGGPPTVTVMRSWYGGWIVALRGRRRSAAVTHPGPRESAEPVADRLAEVLGVKRV